MRNQLTNISCLTGLVLIFLMAAIFRDGYFWIGGVIVLLGIILIRNLIGEITLSTDQVLTTISWFIIIFTLINTRNGL